MERQVMLERVQGRCCNVNLLLNAKTHQLCFPSSVTHRTQETTPTIVYPFSTWLFRLWGSKVKNRFDEVWELEAAGLSDV